MITSQAWPGPLRKAFGTCHLWFALPSEGTFCTLPRS